MSVCPHCGKSDNVILFEHTDTAYDSFIAFHTLSDMGVQVVIGDSESRVIGDRHNLDIDAIIALRDVMNSWLMSMAATALSKNMDKP